MNADEREICLFLKSWQGQFVSGKEIARRAGGKWRFRNDPNWAAPLLTRLVERGIVDTDALGHFRLRPKEKDNRKTWVSPQMKKILERSGKDFKDVISVDEEDDFGDD